MERSFQHFAFHAISILTSSAFAFPFASFSSFLSIRLTVSHVPASVALAAIAVIIIIAVIAVVIACFRSSLCSRRSGAAVHIRRSAKVSSALAQIRSHAQSTVVRAPA